MKDSTIPSLLQNVFQILKAYRPIFKQERTFIRALGLIWGELFVFARHTITQELLALGLTDADWSAWYRLFSRGRFDAERASQILLQQTMQHVPAEQPYVVGIDGVQVPRHSLKMPGTCWLKALGTAPFKPGIHRAQRFLDLSWLIPHQEGYSRAVPLRWLPAFPAKAMAAERSAYKEWEAGLLGLHWLRQQLDTMERQHQWLLSLVDGNFERVVEFWKGLPERTLVLGRTARHRVLLALPHYQGKGRPPSYGDRSRKPCEWLKEGHGWQITHVQVRSRSREMCYRVEGPYVRDGLPEKPLFLIVVKGMDRKVGPRFLSGIRNLQAGSMGAALPS
jgi:hypothetical protein